MTKAERVAKIKGITDAAIESAYQDTTIKEIAKTIETNIKNNIENVIFKGLGFSNRWSNWELSPSSVLADKLQAIVKHMVASIEFKPTPLTEKQKNILQKEFDRRYFEQLRYAARNKADGMALLDLHNYLTPDGEDEE